MNGGMSYYELPNSSAEIEFDKIASFLGSKRGVLEDIDLKEEKFQLGFKVRNWYAGYNFFPKLGTSEVLNPIKGNTEQPQKNHRWF